MPPQWARRWIAPRSPAIASCTPNMKHATGIMQHVQHAACDMPSMRACSMPHALLPFRGRIDAWRRRQASASQGKAGGRKACKACNMRHATCSMQASSSPCSHVRMFACRMLHVAWCTSHGARRMLHASGMLSVTPVIFLHVACLRVASCMSPVCMLHAACCMSQVKCCKHREC